MICMLNCTEQTVFLSHLGEPLCSSLLLLLLRRSSFEFWLFHLKPGHLLECCAEQTKGTPNEVFTKGEVNRSCRGCSSSSSGPKYQGAHRLGAETSLPLKKVSYLGLTHFRLKARNHLSLSGLSLALSFFRSAFSFCSWLQAFERPLTPFAMDLPPAKRHKSSREEERPLSRVERSRDREGARSKNPGLEPFLSHCWVFSKEFLGPDLHGDGCGSK